MTAVINTAVNREDLKPLTSTTPGVMLTLLGKQIIDYNLEFLIENGFDNIIVMLSYQGEVIRNHIYSKNYKANIHFAFGGGFLGSAGGVRNAVGNINEPFLVIDGMLICDYKAEGIMKYHKASGALATAVTSKTDNPEKNCVAICGQDGRIKKLIENPSYTQAVSNNALTGIYVLSPQCLNLIPQNSTADIFSGLIPKLLEENSRVMSYLAEGYCKKITNISSLRRCQFDMLEGKVNVYIPNTFRDLTVKEESNLRIIPPVFMGKNVTVGKNAVIGPYTVIGDGCNLEDNCKLHNAVIGNECYVGRGAKVNGATVGNGCKLMKGSRIFENAVLGDMVTAGEECSVSAEVKIWPNKMLEPHSTVSETVRYSNSGKNGFLQSGVYRGLGGIELTAEKCALLGSALASTELGKKIGTAHDGKPLSRALLMCFTGSALSYASRVWSFGDCLLPQLHFYTSYCSMDCGVYVSSAQDKVQLTLFSQGGLPLPSYVRRELESRIENRAFSGGSGKFCKNTADMSGVEMMYRRALSELCPEGLEGIKARFACDNEKIRILLCDCFNRLGGKIGDSTVFRFDCDGISVTASDSDSHSFSYGTLTAICCMFEAMSGSDTAVPFDAPAVIDAAVEKYGKQSYRYLTAPAKNENSPVEALAKKQPWVRDALMLCFKLLGIMKMTGMGLYELSCSLPEVNEVRRTVKSTVPFYEICDSLNGFSAVSEYKGEGAEITANGAKAVILPLPDRRGIRIVSKALSAEAAKGLCDEVEDRLNSLLLDKEGKKE